VPARKSAAIASDTAKRPRRSTRAVTPARTAIAAAAAELGGVERLVAWVREDAKNESVFWASIYADRLASRPVPTTCFGHTGPEVRVGRRYGDGECAALLEGDLGKEAVGVYRCGPAALAERPLVWAALTDLAHNIGVGAVCRSSAMARFRAGRWREGCGRIGLFDKAGGQVRRGLVRRRASETALCLKGAGG
jgi:lysozyme